MSDEREIIVVQKQKPSIDGTTILVGGGLVALILFLYFRGGGGGAKDKKPLTYSLRSDGIYLGPTKFNSITEAIARVKTGGRNDVSLKVAGDVPQRDVDSALLAFQAAGVAVFVIEPQSISSMYRRGLGQYV